MSFDLPPWEMSRVPLHYVEERRVILRAQFEAKVQLVNEKKEPIIPEF